MKPVSFQLLQQVAYTQSPPAGIGYVYSNDSSRFIVLMEFQFAQMQRKGFVVMSWRSALAACLHKFDLIASDLKDSIPWYNQIC